MAWLAEQIVGVHDNMKPNGLACIVSDPRRKLLCIPLSTVIGTRPGFGLNTNKASIMLNFFLRFFWTHKTASRREERRNGRRGPVFYCIELTPFSANQVRGGHLANIFHLHRRQER